MPNLGLKLPPCLPWILQIIVDGSLSSFFSCLNLPLFIIHENSCACLLKTFGKTLFWKSWASKTWKHLKFLRREEPWVWSSAFDIEVEYVFAAHISARHFSCISRWIHLPRQLEPGFQNHDHTSLVSRRSYHQNREYLLPMVYQLIDDAVGFWKPRLCR